MGQSLPRYKEEPKKSDLDLFPKKDSNPGTFDSYSAETNTILDVKSYDGFVFELNHILNQQFSIGHTLTLGSFQQPPYYSLQAAFRDNNISLIGNIENNGLLHGHLLAQLSDDLTFQTAFKITENNKETLSNGIANLEYFGSNWTGKFEARSNNTFICSYYQRITKNLNIGTRLTRFKTDGNNALMYIARYETKKTISTFSYSDFLNYIALSYVHKINSRIGFASEIVYSIRDHSSFTSLGFKYSMRKSSFQTRFTSRNEIATSLDLNFPMVSLGFSAKLDYKTHKYYAGIRVKIGPRD
ncbi:import receptor subunit tom40 [Anaeramoeba flamelloides]|uniref:Import receptor subunit tom40 n=1 Tax=Anaeramoeba flamelloides TaxID=1746091 RepID=A0ABQ8YH62_9EUKA|nr:import receptor subunit tom40 [Anaeramoeba flamelloides]